MKKFKRAIRYSLKPHEMGLCGPLCLKNSKKILYEYLIGKKVPLKEVKDLLDDFCGAVSYYSLIAEKNGIKDKYDDKVIEAYWLGNDLLKKVKQEDIKKMIFSRFVGPDKLTPEKAEKLAKKIPKDVYAHHTFHVFFIGSVTGRAKLTRGTKDDCRPSWGKVIEVGAGKAEVETETFFPQKIKKIEVDWDNQAVPKLKKGDHVSFHWGRVSEILDRTQLKNLKKYTYLNFKAWTDKRSGNTEKFDLIKKDVFELLPDSPLDFELAHAKLVLKWTLRLDPKADEALKIAAISHDIDRAMTGITEKDLKDFSKLNEF